MKTTGNLGVIVIKMNGHQSAIKMIGNLDAINIKMTGLRSAIAFTMIGHQHVIKMTGHQDAFRMTGNLGAIATKKILYSNTLKMSGHLEMIAIGMVGLRGALTAAPTISSALW